MTARYLLPCSCGQQLVIERRQAGEMVPCPACGAAVQAPTLLGMTSLEPAPAEEADDAPPTATASTWGIRQAMIFVGGILLAVALVGAALLLQYRPVSRFDMIDPEQVRAGAKTLPPLRTSEIWDTMLQGLDRRQDQQYVAAMIHFRAWQIVTGVVAISGIALVGIGAALKKKRPA